MWNRREGVARSLKLYRRNAIGARWRKSSLTRPLREYSEILGRDLGRVVELKLALNERFGKKQKISVLDIGCGACVALAELKRMFGNRVSASGINISAFPSPARLRRRKAYYQKLYGPGFQRVLALSELYWRNRASLDNQRVGLMEKHDFGGKKFDLVVSVATIGASHYPLAAIENILNHLKPHGACLLDLSGVMEEDYDKIVLQLDKTMPKAGFQGELNNSVLMLVAPKKPRKVRFGLV